jgi:HEAT repeat protein
MSKKREKGLPFEEAIMRLDTSETPELATLIGLSDPDPTQIKAFDKIWRALDDDRRAEITGELRDQAMRDVEVTYAPLFKHMLSDSDPRVRAEAAAGLWEDDEPAIITPLVTLVRRDPSQAVRAAAAYALGHFMYLAESGQLNQARRDEIYTVLIDAVRHAPDVTPLYQRALEGLGYSGSDEVDFYLRSALASDEEDLRLSGVIGMGRSGNTAYAPLVRGELGHLSPHVRRESAFASGELEDTDAVKALGELFDDGDAGVREAAVHALAKIGTLDGRRLLDEAAKSEDETFSAQAQEAIQMYELLHGQFDFNMGLFDEASRTSFHTIKPDVEDQTDK